MVSYSAEPASEKIADKIAQHTKEGADAKPPKKSNGATTDLHHVTFHFFKSAVFLSVPSSSTVLDLKSQLLSALSAPSFQSTYISPNAPHLPEALSENDFRIYGSAEDSMVEGQEDTGGLKSIEGNGQGDGGEKGLKTSLRAKGWGRWKRLYVSFRNASGGFDDPIYTVPDVDDEMEEEP